MNKHRCNHAYRHKINYRRIRVCSYIYTCVRALACVCACVHVSARAYTCRSIIIYVPVCTQTRMYACIAGTDLHVCIQQEGELEGGRNKDCERHIECI